MEEYQDFPTLYTALTGSKFSAFSDKLLFKTEMITYKSSGSKYVPHSKHVKFYLKHILVLKVRFSQFRTNKPKKGNLFQWILAVE